MNHLPQAYIYRGELDFISGCVIQYPDIETGGDFFGFWSREGDPVIQFVIGPGDQTTRTGTSFFQDIHYLRECGAFLHNSFKLEHIGAWHSHHQMNLTRPSAGDVQTMRNALRNEHPSRFLISICNIESSKSVSVGCFLFSRGNPQDYNSCNIQVLPGNSPVRESVLRGDSGANPLGQTAQKFHSGMNYNAPMFTLRSTQTTPPPRETGKPHFAEDSFWSKREGHKFLKSIFDRLEESQDVSVVEIKQLADGRPALAFNHHGTTYEIRFPDDFPRSVPEVLVIRSSQQAGRFFWKRKDGNTDFPRLEEVRRIINALGLLDDHREIGISEQQ